jgi:hypothetical protein
MSVVEVYIERLQLGKGVGSKSDIPNSACHSRTYFILGASGYVHCAIYVFTCRVCRYGLCVWFLWRQCSFCRSWKPAIFYEPQNTNQKCLLHCEIRVHFPPFALQPTARFINVNEEESFVQMVERSPRASTRNVPQTRVWRTLHAEGMWGSTSCVPRSRNCISCVPRCLLHVYQLRPELSTTSMTGCVRRLVRNCTSSTERDECTKCPAIGRCFTQCYCTLLYTQLYAHIRNCWMISTAQLL